MTTTPDESDLDKIFHAGIAFRSGDWRASAEKYRAAYEEASPSSIFRFSKLNSFTAVFHDNRISPPSTSDLPFMRRILQSEVEPLIYRAHCASVLAILTWRQGDLKAAAERYRRGIALAESATEADRRVVLGAPRQDIRQFVDAGAAIDRLLDDMRGDLATIEEQFSIANLSGSIPDQSIRTMKMKTAATVGDLQQLAHECRLILGGLRRCSAYVRRPIRLSS
ncbi:hypothetical protein BDK51DRAFT_33962 [Blyttiomyces helicus]|uniref:Uncharacterized protein n=1 Tax=Blyttiomyces helicus TaxID=388810 RepID=A0A4P9VU54_9FUNG|nr:hypothetical protein BDK51DRAFT_33962 [Blyttiomyces helicus]|eukprot:RKO83094.1 hypothetical protein BDK51DRAFT_33962 [Blyttiomyces helicus]